MARIPLMALLPPLVFAALAAVFLLGLGRENPDALPSTLVGNLAPPLVTTQLIEGPPVTSADLTGDGVKLVNYWASWCAPCRIEHPNLMKLAEQGIPIYGVNYKDDPVNARAFLAELGDPYVAVGADENGRNGLEWGVYGLPETFVIGSGGKVFLRYAGPVTERVLAERIRPAIETARLQTGQGD